jgi:putative membrane protein
MWGYMHEYGWNGMGFGMVSMLLFWVLLILAIIALIKYTRSSGNSSERNSEKTALDILKERYARGEIEREEFDQKKHDLKD